jgi:hypothetical protein
VLSAAERAKAYRTRRSLVAPTGIEPLLGGSGESRPLPNRVILQGYFVALLPTDPVHSRPFPTAPLEKVRIRPTIRRATATRESVRRAWLSLTTAAAPLLALTTRVEVSEASALFRSQGSHLVIGAPEILTAEEEQPYIAMLRPAVADVGNRTIDIDQ